MEEDCWPCSSQGRTASFRRMLRIRAMLVLCASTCGGAWGTTPHASDGLTLQQVVEVALESSVGVRLARSQVRAGEGDLLVAQSIYDPIFTASGLQATTSDPSLSAGADTTDTSSTITLDLSQRLASGLQLVPSLTIDQTDLDGAPAISTGTVGVRVVVPLMEGRGGKSGRFRLRAAEDAYEGNQRDLSHQGALSVFEAVAGYWRYLAAEKNLEVLRVSERRAEDLVKEMHRLVEGEERPSADLIQVQGNAAIKRISRISAEQTLIVARRQLGLAMGISGRAIGELPPPTDPFPPAQPFVADPRAVTNLVEVAIENRADLQAQNLREGSARWTAEAAETDLKPKLDLAFSAGYSGIDAGGGLGPFFGSLSNDVSGLSTSVLLSYQLPLRNAADRGSALHRRAFLEQQEILTEDLERQVWTAVTVAAEALDRGAQQAIEAQRAVSLSSTTVDNEKKKGQLGLATLFDVIQAEDNLTSAQLTEVAAQQTYATALATLRFEIGSLLSTREPTVLSVDVTSLTQPPGATDPTFRPATGGDEGGGPETR